MKNSDLIAWLQQRDPEEQISLAGSKLATLVYADACRCSHVRSSHQMAVARCTICECEQFDGEA